MTAPTTIAGAMMTDDDILRLVAEKLGNPLLFEDLKEDFTVHTEAEDWIKFARALLSASKPAAIDGQEAVGEVVASTLRAEGVRVRLFVPIPAGTKLYAAPLDKGASKPAVPVVLPPMPEHVLADLQSATQYMQMWAKGEALYAPKNGYDEPGIKSATISDVKKSAKYLAPRLRDASFALQDYFAAIDAARAAFPQPVAQAEQELTEKQVTCTHPVVCPHAFLDDDGRWNCAKCMTAAQPASGGE